MELKGLEVKSGRPFKVLTGPTLDPHYGGVNVPAPPGMGNSVSASHLPASGTLSGPKAGPRSGFLSNPLHLVSTS